MHDAALAHELDDAAFHDIANGDENTFWWNDDRVFAYQSQVSFRSTNVVLL